MHAHLMMLFTVILCSARLVFGQDLIEDSKAVVKIELLGVKSKETKSCRLIRWSVFRLLEVRGLTVNTCIC